MRHLEQTLVEVALIMAVAIVAAMVVLTVIGWTVTTLETLEVIL